MEIYIIVTGLFGFFIACVTFILLNRIFKLTKENLNLKEYLKRADNMINTARWGNFQIKLNEENDKLGLYKSLNNLFESLMDRDLVINEYREKEKETANLKEEFIAALTHDLKVPIIAQDKTYDLFLQNKFGELKENQREVLHRLKDSNSDLKALVNSILEAHKIEYTGVILNVEKNIDVENFLKNCIENFKDLINCENREINLFIDTKNLCADFDKLLLKRVINNLIINSINHSKKSDKIDIHLNKIADTFSIDVIDYGDGIDEEEIQKIFNKYYSISNKTTRFGAGLGLYVSNKIIKKHKGVIEAESKKGEGSIFRIILPISQEMTRK